MTCRKRRETLLSIGGIVGHLRAPPDAGIDRLLRDKYDPFRLPPAPWVGRDFTIDLEWGESRRSDLPPASPEVRISTDSIAVARSDFEARLARVSGGPWTGQGRCDANPYSFDSLLRVIWSALIGRAGGALLHAAGLSLEGRAFVFPGPSGSGKTTLARKPDDPLSVLSDEIVPVRRGGDGRWRAWHSPFWGESGKGPGSLRSYPLEAVVFPMKGSMISVTGVNAAEAARRLLAAFICFETDPAADRLRLDAAARLASEVPVLEAATRLDSTAAEIFEGLRTALGGWRTAAPAVPDSREAISEIRARLSVRGQHAIVARGGSMRPFLRDGDTLILRGASEADARAGDVVAVWHPGERPEDDALICHRLLAPRRGGPFSRLVTKGDALPHLERFSPGRDAEVIAVVSAVSRGGGRCGPGGRAAKAAMTLASLAAVPLRWIRNAAR